MKEPAKMLLLEDNLPDAALVTEFLRNEGLNLSIKQVDTSEAFIEALKTTHFDVIVSDYSLPSFDGISALKIAREIAAGTPFVFYSGSIGEESAIEALKMGATDYILKQHPQRLPSAIRRAMDDASIRRERKEAREKVAAQARLLDLASDAIIVFSPDNKIHFWNQSAEKIFGFSDSEASDQPFNSLLGLSNQFEEARQKCLSQGLWDGELELVSKAGNAVIVHSRWTIVTEAGQTKFLTINTDITEIKRLEAHIRHAQRIETIGQLASGVAHDLNNVLAPIIMASELMDASNPDAGSQQLIGMIRNSARRGADIVKQILTFARGSEGKKAPFDPTQVLKEICQLTSKTFPGSIQVKCNIQEHLKPVTGDPTQIHQLIMNLCVNARDAMPDGGSLAITASIANNEDLKAAPELEKTQEFIFIEVRDSGQGISPENMEKIFDPFFTTKAPGKGTGLGLSTSLGILKAHGGTMKVKSRVGEGTVFQVFIPAIISSETGNTSPDLAKYSGNGELVLVVDDEPSIREVNRRLLIDFGYSVITAADGYAGIIQAVAHRNALKVVLTDIRMPEMDGVYFAHSIRSLVPGIKILVSTGSVEQRPAGFADVEMLPKPLSSSELLKAVKQAITAQEEITVNG